MIYFTFILPKFKKGIWISIPNLTLFYVKLYINAFCGLLSLSFCHVSCPSHVISRRFFDLVWRSPSRIGICDNISRGGSYTGEKVQHRSFCIVVHDPPISPLMIHFYIVYFFLLSVFSICCSKFDNRFTEISKFDCRIPMPWSVKNMPPSV